MNTRLLRRVAKHILAEPKRLNMNLTLNRLDRFRAEKEIKPGEMPPCGTVGCIAGLTCIVSDVVPREHEQIMATARNLLGLTGTQADSLFAEPKFSDGSRPCDYKALWPKKFATLYLKAKTPRGRASATVARIEHFIKTKGKE